MRPSKNPQNSKSNNIKTVFIEARLTRLQGREMGLELLFMKMVAYMRVSGFRTFGQAMVMNCTQTLTLIMASMLMVSRMRRVYILGTTGKCMMGNGAMVASKATVFGVALMGSNLTSGNGLIVKQKGTACMCGRTGTNSRVNGIKI